MKFLLTLVCAFAFATNSFAILSTPSLVAPSNGAVNQAPNELLDWGFSSGATAYEYKLGTVSSLNGVPIQSVSGATQVNTSNLLFGTVYYWQVRAIKTTAPIDSSDWSTIINFTTINQISLVAPAINAQNQAPNEVLD
jgi:hypothetical protein